MIADQGLHTDHLYPSTTGEWDTDIPSRDELPPYADSQYSRKKPIHISHFDVASPRTQTIARNPYRIEKTSGSVRHPTGCALESERTENLSIPTKYRIQAILVIISSVKITTHIRRWCSTFHIPFLFILVRSNHLSIKPGNKFNLLVLGHAGSRYFPVSTPPASGEYANNPIFS